MNKTYILGIDIGLTVIKAIIFSEDGIKIASGHVQGINSYPRSHWVERDMESVFKWVCQAIKQAVSTSNISSENIKAIGIAAHGDGVFLVDEDIKPIRPAILSLDSRASDIMDEWQSNGKLQEAIKISGQFPFVGNAAPILAWLKYHEPESYGKIRWILTCKDWVRYKLTHEVNTDFTESSNAFTNVHTQIYDKELYKIYGLVEMEGKMPPVKMPYEIAGKISREVSEKTGLVEGTPVATGMHDMNACAVGTGCINPGQLAIITGTWGINLAISDKPSTNPDWLCRNFIQPGLWSMLSASPASASNLEWMVQNLCQEECQKARETNVSQFAFVNKEVEEVLDEESKVFFIPFLFGSPYGEKPSASFIGIRGWHHRAHLFKSIYEGVVFNHKVHVDILKKGVVITDIRFSGGGAKSLIWSQLFADMLNAPVEVTNVDEAGALGAAICGAVAVGLYSSIGEAVNKILKISRVHVPDQQRHQRLERAFEMYSHIVTALNPVWNEIG